MIGYYGTLDNFFQEDTWEATHQSIFSRQTLGQISKILNLDVNPARTKALRKRKLGLAVNQIGDSNNRQLVLSWKT
jgi:hypothetical protein